MPIQFKRIVRGLRKNKNKFSHLVLQAKRNGDPFTMQTEVKITFVRNGTTYTWTGKPKALADLDAMAGGQDKVAFFQLDLDMSVPDPAKPPFTEQVTVTVTVGGVDTPNNPADLYGDDEN